MSDEFFSFVTMVNPNTGDEADVHPGAYENVWKDKGWTLKGAPKKSAPADEAAHKKESK